MSIVIDTPDGMKFFQMLQCQMALRVQRDTGLTHSQGSVLKLVKRRYGIKGMRIASACEQMDALVEGAQQAHKGTSHVSCTYANRDQIEAFIRGAATQGLELAMPPAEILRMIPWDNEEKTTKTITWEVE